MAGKAACSAENAPQTPLPAIGIIISVASLDLKGISISLPPSQSASLSQFLVLKGIVIY